jgi:kumamolisin
VFSKPEYQASVAGTMRGVPDVAGVADPETGWTIRADGRDQSVGGTSAVAPMWSAIHALLCRRAGKRLGPVPALYYQHPEACRDVVGGDNQGYPAAAGWDPATGLGSPNGPALFALAGGTPAPTPTPPANPPAPGSAPLLTLTFPRGVARGQWVRFRSPVALSPGKYGLAAEAA